MRRRVLRVSSASVLYGGAAVGRAIEIGGDEDEDVTEAERLLGRLEGELRYIDVGEIFERGLLPFLEGIQTTCRRVGEEIQRTFFLI